MKFIEKIKNLFSKKPDIKRMDKIAISNYLDVKTSTKESRLKSARQKTEQAKPYLHMHKAEHPDWHEQITSCLKEK